MSKVWFIQQRLIQQIMVVFAAIFTMQLAFANNNVGMDMSNISAQNKGKILVVMTNHSKYPTRKDTTGLWVTELTHFYDVARKAGYDMDFVSPKGGAVPLDERSQKWIYMDKEARMHLADPAFMNLLNNTLKPTDVKASDYKAIYFTGGYGVMRDFPNNPELTALAEQIYRQGGVVSAVCHGVAGVLALKDEQGKSLIANRKVTGFSNREEVLSGMKKQVPFSLEDQLKSKGAIYSEGFLPFTSFVVVDDRIITGQNPQSPREVGVEVVKRLATAR
ncbi:MAG: type 1 glutamine amidotransferase domain-containing protein [Acinetobacter sp.]|uniref:type 1 glutamine amidotransferase domain-containing protein n=1 Tax=Acinetobacter sp. TaxID=472 RepID=UPI0026E0B0F0|nr:type 1 glutamine amidotransferase domain-containing protein [Acinetobacter sp.]MDO5543525.1 type 1 glutamine amidotransferase domain-containing protein [Acinetobacter sp.]